MEPLSAEDKEKQIFDSIKKVEGELLTEVEELQILNCKGIEFKAGSLTLYISPLKIKQLELLYEISQIQASEETMLNKFSKVSEILSQILGISTEDIKANMSIDEITDLIRVLTYSMLNGKRIFQKKSLNMAEIR